MKRYYVYILSNHSRTLYIGVTNDIQRRVWDHKNGTFEGFTKKYRLNKLVYFLENSDVRNAIEHEKRIKGWVRRKKVALVEKDNPGWDDLSETWG